MVQRKSIVRRMEKVRSKVGKFAAIVKRSEVGTMYKNKNMLFVIPPTQEYPFIKEKKVVKRRKKKVPTKKKRKK